MLHREERLVLRRVDVVGAMVRACAPAFVLTVGIFLLLVPHWMLMRAALLIVPPLADVGIRARRQWRS
eukprot:4846149-Pleurochrysis_carterae.AAC.1